MCTWCLLKWWSILLPVHRFRGVKNLGKALSSCSIEHTHPIYILDKATVDCVCLGHCFKRQPISYVDVSEALRKIGDSSSSSTWQPDRRSKRPWGSSDAFTNDGSNLWCVWDPVHNLSHSPACCAWILKRGRSKVRISPRRSCQTHCCVN